MKYSLYIAVIIIFSIPYKIAAQSNKSLQIKENTAPKYLKEAFISLEELYKINVNEFDKYYINDVTCIDVDDNLNLYVLDYYEAQITVFNKDGKYVRTMGGKGQGPNELERPIAMNIYNNKIYICQDHKGLKIFDLQGKYVDFNITKMGNYKVIKAFDEYFLTVNTKLSLPLGQKFDYIIEKQSLDAKNITTIWDVSYIGDHPNIISHDYYLAMDSQKNIYIPEDHEKYKINKLTLDGKLLLTFGREYKRISYSDKMKERFKKVISNAPAIITVKPYPKYPPVVRYIVVDDNNYIWVAVGEFEMDSHGEFKVVSTIDIFNENGEFLYTFDTPHLGRRSIIRKERLYSNPTQDDQNIRVFQIKYNK